MDFATRPIPIVMAAAVTIAIAPPAFAEDFDAIVAQEKYYEALRAFEAKDLESCIKLCDGILRFQPEHIKAMALRKKATSALSTKRTWERYLSMNKTPDGIRVRFEYRNRFHGGPYKAQNGWGYPNILGNESIHEFHLLVSNRWSFGKILNGGIGGGMMAGKALGGHAFGLYLRPFLGIALVPFSDRFGLQLQLAPEYGYRRVRFERARIKYVELSGWTNFDFHTQLLIQLARWNVIIGVAIDQKARASLVLGLEGF